MPRDRQRPVRLFDKLDVFFSHNDVKCSEQVLEVCQTRRAHDRRGHAWLREHPRECDLRHARALALRELFNAV